MKNNDVIRDTWNSFARIWAVGVVPHRPSGEEVGIYEECIRRSLAKLDGKARVLILGATPELRDLVARLDLEAVLVDINPNMVEAMTSLLEYSRGQEQVVIADWLKMPFADNSFDIIMCDQGINNIKFEKWSRFLREVKRVLSPRGFFIKNIYTLEENEALEIEALPRVIDKQNFSQHDKFYYVHRCLPLLQDVEGSKYYKDLGELKKRILVLKKNGKLTARQCSLLMDPEEMYSYRLVVPFKHEVDRIFTDKFLVKAVKNGWGHPMITFSKIYYCQNK